MARIESSDDGRVFAVSIDPTAQWDHSKFPHPLLTVDYNAEGGVIQVVAVGTLARQLSAETVASLAGLLPEGVVAEVAKGMSL